MTARTALQKRSRELADLKIEFMASEQFERPNAEAVIMAETPSVEFPENAPKAPAGVSPFLAALYEFALLTQPQEHHLFRKMNFLKYRASCLRDEKQAAGLTKFHCDRIERWLAKALRIRDHLIQSNLRLVVSIAKKVVDHANTFEELVSEGIPPLIRAVEIFNFDRGTRFSTYATWAIRNSLFRASPRNRKRHSRFRTSADTHFESVEETRMSVHAELSYHRELRKTVKQGLTVLDDRDRKIVKARFALDGSERPKRFREIAETLNISTERVRQLFARSIGQMQEVVEAEALTIA